LGTCWGPVGDLLGTCWGPVGSNDENADAIKGQTLADALWPTGQGRLFF